MKTAPIMVGAMLTAHQFHTSAFCTPIANHIETSTLTGKKLHSNLNKIQPKTYSEPGLVKDTQFHFSQLSSASDANNEHLATLLHSPDMDHNLTYSGPKGSRLYFDFDAKHQIEQQLNCAEQHLPNTFNLQKNPELLELFKSTIQKNTHLKNVDPNLLHCIKIDDNQTFDQLQSNYKGSERFNENQNVLKTAMKLISWGHKNNTITGHTWGGSGYCDAHKTGFQLLLVALKG